VPVAGNPLNTTLPVDSLQEGCVICPTTGAVGVTGCGKIVTFAELAELQPVAFLTINVYVFGSSPLIVVLVPDPLVITSPGILISVQAPIPGNPDRTTLPVATRHVG
jgi:hypothetical protein